MQNQIRSFFILFLSTSLIFSNTLPIFAVEAITPTAQGYVAVKTLEQAQQNEAVSSSYEALPADDFLNDGPLSKPTSEFSVSNELNAQAEVYLSDAAGASFSAEEFLSALSNDTYSGTSVMWGFSRVKAEQAWAYTRGAGATIAVIDTGLDFNHIDILGNVYLNTGEIAGDGIDNDRNGLIDDYRGWDFVNNDNYAFDDNGHGTHVSGIAAAVEDNGKGIAGVAPDAKIIPIKVLDAAGSGTIDNVIKGIRYAADLGAKVINMSLGVAKQFLSSTLLGAFQNAINYATNKGSVVITAAGNENVNTSTTAPAGLNNTIAIGATDSADRKASFSNKSPDIAAPGVTIGSLKAGGGYIYMSGTSMASPFAAGAAALIMSYYGSTYAQRGYTGQQIYNDVYSRLTGGAVDLPKRGYDASFGFGLLDVYKSLTLNVGATVTATSTGESSPSYFSTRSLRSSFRSFSFEGSSAGATPEFLSRIAQGNWYRIPAAESPLSLKKKKK